MPLEGELRDVIERRRAAAILKDVNGGSRFAECVFHRKGESVGDFRKSRASASVAAGLGKMGCPKCQSEGSAAKCENCKVPTRYSGTGDEACFALTPESGRQERVCPASATRGICAG